MLSSTETAIVFQRIARGHAINASVAADRARRPKFKTPTERRQAELEATQVQGTASFAAHVARQCIGAVE